MTNLNYDLLKDPSIMAKNLKGEVDLKMCTLIDSIYPICKDTIDSNELVVTCLNDLVAFRRSLNIATLPTIAPQSRRVQLNATTPQQRVKKELSKVQADPADVSSETPAFVYRTPTAQFAANQNRLEMKPSKLLDVVEAPKVGNSAQSDNYSSNRCAATSTSYDMSSDINQKLTDNTVDHNRGASTSKDVSSQDQFPCNSYNGKDILLIKFCLIH